MEDEVSLYMQAKFEHTIRARQGMIRIPASWPLTLLLECDHAVRIIARAFQNQSEWGLFH